MIYLESCRQSRELRSQNTVGITDGGDSEEIRSHGTGNQLKCQRVAEEGAAANMCVSHRGNHLRNPVGKRTGMVEKVSSSSS